MTTRKQKPVSAANYAASEGIENNEPTDTLTVLAVMPGRRATKLVRNIQGSFKPSIEGFDAGMYYMLLHPLSVTTITELSLALTALEGLPNMFVIRGAPEPHVRPGDMHRRLGSGNGESFSGNFRTPEQGRNYVLMDFDDIPLPRGLLLTNGTAVEVCEYLVSLLPPEFEYVSYHWQLSSSAGLKDPSVASAHIWFWLRTPIPDPELLRWAKKLKETNGQKTVDTALFQHVQAHYTAAPIFEGMPDPFPTRSGLIKKKLGSVDVKLPPADVIAIGHKSTSTIPTHGGNGFEHFLSQIGDHEGGNGFHMPIVQAIASYVSSHGTDDTDVEHLIEIMQDRVHAADAALHDTDYVEKMASEEHLIPAIRGAITKYGAAANQRKGKLYQGLTSHFTTTPTTITVAGQQLADKLQGLF